MNTRLSILESQLLAGCVADLAVFAARPFPNAYGYSKEKQQFRDAQEGSVRCDPSRWAECDLQDPSQRVAVSRAYKRLERRQLVERIAEGGSVTTHLKPTDAGKAMAAELTRALHSCTAEHIEGHPGEPTPNGTPASPEPATDG